MECQSGVIRHKKQGQFEEEDRGPSGETKANPHHQHRIQWMMDVNFWHQWWIQWEQVGNIRSDYQSSHSILFVSQSIGHRF
jgi:hypothetical protein